MKAYAFSNTIVLINGVEITGWAEGDDVIGIKRRVDSMTDKVGAGGDMMVSISSDKSGEIDFKLQQTSPSNSFLSQLVAQQEFSGKGGGVFNPANFQFLDTSRNDLAQGSPGYIVKPADMSRGEHAATQDWKVIVENLDMLLGSDN
jgi:hypothetical protein